MTDVETVTKDLESVWIQLPEEVRVAYGQNYLKKCRVNIKLTNDLCVFVYLFLKYTNSGRLIFYMDLPRWWYNIKFIMLIHVTSV